MTTRPFKKQTNKKKSKLKITEKNMSCRGLLELFNLFLDKASIKWNWNIFCGTIRGSKGDFRVPCAAKKETIILQ